MRIRTMLALAAVSLLASAAIGDVIGGTGPLDDIDYDAGTVTIGPRTFNVTRTTEYKDGHGRSSTLLEFERKLGEWVDWKAIERRPRPLLERLEITPEDGDAIE